jgi:hypothetical protein
VSIRCSSAAVLILLTGRATIPMPVRGEAQPKRRVVRIGVDLAAPYQSWVECHGPIGFTVEVIGAADRKRGIELQWTFCPDGPQRALRAGKVDLWPLLASRTAQEAGFYGADPWLENEYSIIWRGTGSSSREEESDWTPRTARFSWFPRIDPAFLKLVPDPTAPPGARYTSGYGLVTPANGLSLIAPRWSSLTACDLNQGTIKPACGFCDHGNGTRRCRAGPAGANS